MEDERSDNMIIVCLDMEGVLTPENWIAFADKVGIPDFQAYA